MSGPRPLHQRHDHEGGFIPTVGVGLLCVGVPERVVASAIAGVVLGDDQLDIGRGNHIHRGLIASPYVDVAPLHHRKGQLGAIELKGPSATSRLRENGGGGRLHDCALEAESNLIEPGLSRGDESLPPLRLDLCLRLLRREFDLPPYFFPVGFLQLGETCRRGSNGNVIEASADVGRCRPRLWCLVEALVYQGGKGRRDPGKRRRLLAKVLITKVLRGGAGKGPAACDQLEGHDSERIDICCRCSPLRLPLLRRRVGGRPRKLPRVHRSRGLDVA